MGWSPEWAGAACPAALPLRRGVAAVPPRPQVVDHAMADWLADYRFSGEIWGYPEGEIYFPGSPIVIVESTFGEAWCWRPAPQHLQPRLGHCLRRSQDDGRGR